MIILTFPCTLKFLYLTEALTHPTNSLIPSLKIGVHFQSKDIFIFVVILICNHHKQTFLYISLSLFFYFLYSIPWFSEKSVPSESYWLIARLLVTVLKTAACNYFVDVVISIFFIVFSQTWRPERFSPYKGAWERKKERVLHAESEADKQQASRSRRHICMCYPTKQGGGT